MCAPSGGLQQAWYAAATHSQKAFVLDAVNRSGSVDVFLSTDDCPGWTEQLHSYEPYLRAASVSSTSSTRSHKFHRGVEMMDNAGMSYDVVVLTRPDLLWHQRVSVADFLPSLEEAPFGRGIVYPHKCEPQAWKLFQCVSDTFIAASADVFRELRSRCTKDLFDRVASTAHMTYSCALKEHVVDADQVKFYLGSNRTLLVNTRKTSRGDFLEMPYFLPGGSDSDAQEHLDFALDAIRHAESSSSRRR